MVKSHQWQNKLLICTRLSVLSMITFPLTQRHHIITSTKLQCETTEVYL